MMKNTLEQYDTITDHFEKKVISYKADIFGYCLKRLHDPYICQDLCQDILYKALKNKDKYKENNKLLNWLYTIARNECINHMRKNNRKKTDDLIPEIQHSIIINNTAISNLSVKEIQSCINTLSPELRTPLTMCLDGYDYQYIAEHMELPLGTIKSRIFYARKGVQKMLDTRYNVTSSVL